MMATLLRVGSGLLAAIVLAAMLHAGLLGAALPSAAQHWSLSQSFLTVLGYGLPLAAVAAALTEYLRLRHLAVHGALGAVLAIAAGYLAVRAEPMTAPAFSGGAMKSLFVLLIGILPALAYWSLAGRRAGWRGDAAERSGKLTAEAFRTASANAQGEPCRLCAAVWTAAGFLLFALVSWISIDVSGLRNWLVAETEGQARVILTKAGHAWAQFRIEGSRGVLTGLAPDEVQKRAAFDAVREGLTAVTGFPGVLAHIDNETVARLPMSAMTQQLADAERRENDAVVAAQAAKIAEESARAAEADAKRSAEEQARVASQEIKSKLEEQARMAEGELKRKLEEQARVAEAEIKRKLDEQARAAQEEASQHDVAGPAATAEPAEVAALEEATAAQSTPDAGESAPAPAPSASSASTGCSPQDMAIIESSRIQFDLQGFDVRPADGAELDRLAASVKACTPRAILITGYADMNRDSVFNPALGLQRAQSVRENLINRGVPAGFVVASSGKHQADHDVTPQQRAFNRRTEFRFLEATEISRDATLDPDERATTCESDLSAIMAQSIIHFPTASSRISEESLGLVRKLARAIQTCGSVVVTVEGHTDKIGAENYNQGLSEMRSNAVREALVAAGADPTRLAARGFAASRPYDPAESAQAYALNRRIEFKVSGKFTTTNTGGP